MSRIAGPFNLLIVLLISVLFFNVGCSSVSGRVKQGLQPANMIEPYFEKKVAPSFASGAFRDECDRLVKENKFPEAKMERNKVIDHFINGISIHYGHYKDYLVQGKAAIDTLTDITVLTSAALSALFKDVDVIRSLGAFSTVVQGSKAAADRNFLIEKSMQMIAIKMDQLRATKYADIKNKKLLDYDKYTLDEAIFDATEYFNAGTVTYAVLAIVSEAGAKKEQADTEAKKTDNLTVEKVRSDIEAEIAKSRALKEKLDAEMLKSKSEKEKLEKKE